MHLQNVIYVLAWMLCISIQGIEAKANNTAKVEVPIRTSALAVLVDNKCKAFNPTTNSSEICVEADTAKTFEELARELQKEEDERVSDPDSAITAPIDSARLKQLSDSLMAKPIAKPVQKPQFIPNPTRALWLSLVLPGAGQIYNRKYWKLPFIYGGFLGCAYALMWNQMMYRDYSQAYLDIMDDDPNTKSYLDMLPPRYDITGREDQFKSIFKRKKDYYRRYRDLSAFCFVGVYLLSVIDAYVDAQLSVFDISNDLSLKVQPTVIGTQNMLGSTNRAAYGVGCSLNF